MPTYMHMLLYPDFQNKSLLYGRIIHLYTGYVYLETVREYLAFVYLYILSHYFEIYIINDSLRIKNEEISLNNLAGRGWTHHGTKFRGDWTNPSGTIYP